MQSQSLRVGLFLTIAVLLAYLPACAAFARARARTWLGASHFEIKVNPDEAVAIGAAIQGSILAGRRIKKQQGGEAADGKDQYAGEMVLLDVTPLSLGIGLQVGGWVRTYTS